MYFDLCNNCNKCSVSLSTIEPAVFVGDVVLNCSTFFACCVHVCSLSNRTKSVMHLLLNSSSFFGASQCPSTISCAYVGFDGRSEALRSATFCLNVICSLLSAVSCVKLFLGLSSSLSQCRSELLSPISARPRIIFAALTGGSAKI